MFFKMHNEQYWMNSVLNVFTGMLRGLNGHVFKPIDKAALGEREISFYENLTVSVNPADMEFLRYTPAFYGAKDMKVFDKS